MVIELKLLEIVPDEVTKSVLNMGPVRGAFGDALSRLNAVRGRPVSERFWCPESRLDFEGCKCEEGHWGPCKATPYGDPLKSVSAGEILVATEGFSDDEEWGWQLPKKRGVYAYLKAVPKDRRFAMYFY